LKLFFILSLLLSSVGNSDALEELDRIEYLASIPGPDQRNIGWEWHYIDQKGEPGFMRKVAATATTASYTRTDGCEWTRPILGFAPATVWSRCPSTGKSAIRFLGGNIWPIKVGNKFNYSIKGISSLFGSAWGSERECEVKYSVRVRIVSGEYDTHKLVCEERWGTRSWWLALSVGTAVAYQQKTFQGKLILQEMTRIKY
jgi:hypothetical protein